MRLAALHKIGSAAQRRCSQVRETPCSLLLHPLGRALAMEYWLHTTRLPSVTTGPRGPHVVCSTYRIPSFLRPPAFVPQREGADSTPCETPMYAFIRGL